jgi:hypothetical protein
MGLAPFSTRGMSFARATSMLNARTLLSLPLLVLAGSAACGDDDLPARSSDAGTPPGPSDAGTPPAPDAPSSGDSATPTPDAGPGPECLEPAAPPRSSYPATVTFERSFDFPDTTMGALLFRYADGRLVAKNDNVTALYSSDGGEIWEPGPLGAAEQRTTIELADGIVLGLGRATTQEEGDRYYLRQVRIAPGELVGVSESGYYDTPGAISIVDDTGMLATNHGYFVHHGIVELRNGDLLISLYGNQLGDTAEVDGFPPEWDILKTRLLVMRSSDRGLEWGDAQTVAYDRMLDPATGEIVPAIAQEGFNESDLVRAPNGDLLLVARTSDLTNEFPDAPVTPMYQMRSSDEGHTWTPPEAIAPFGASPNIVLLDTGILVVAYSGGAGGRLLISDDSGVTWQQETVVTRSDSYMDVAQVSGDRVLVMHFDDDDHRMQGSFFTIRGSGPASIYLRSAEPCVSSGSETLLEWRTINANGCVLSGGPFGAGNDVGSVGANRSTGPLTEDTTFTLRCQSRSAADMLGEASVTVRIR